MVVIVEGHNDESRLRKNMGCPLIYNVVDKTGIIYAKISCVGDEDKDKYATVDKII